jgi:hypothetical protein
MESGKTVLRIDKRFNREARRLFSQRSILIAVVVAGMSASAACSSAGGVRSDAGGEIQHRDFPRQASKAQLKTGALRAIATTSPALHELVKNHVTRETIEAFLVAADQIVHSTAKAQIEPAAEASQLNRLQKMARALREIYQLHTRAFMERADLADASIQAQLDSANATLARIEATSAGRTEALLPHDLAFFYSSEMKAPEAHRHLKHLLDRHVVLQVEKLDQVSAALLDAQEVLKFELERTVAN